jgi:hypothetical protein
MDIAATESLIIQTLQVLASSVLAILGSVITIAVAYLVYKYGWRMFTDESICLWGFYPRQTPWKGYNRFRSRKWNERKLVENIASM